MADEWTVRRLNRERCSDFARLHCEGNGMGWCHCVAWWTPTWEGWGDRSAEDNARLRAELFERGEYDGYLLYAAERPIGWCQVGPRDRLEKLVQGFGFALDPGTWAITCFAIAPDERGRGAARALLREVLADLPARGAERVEAYPKRGQGLDTLDLWNGPESLFASAGFAVVREAEPRIVMALELAPA